MAVLTESRPSRTDTIAGANAGVAPLTQAHAGTVFLREKDRLLFSPLFFLVGFLAGFFVCCFLGWLTTTKNQFGDFHRFEAYCSPATFMYPTLAQMVAIAKEKGQGDKILVVIGSSSIFNGVGQTDRELWSVKLQELLGPKYAVVNLSQRSCFAFGGGYYAAEALVKEGRKVIFLTGGRPHAPVDPLEDKLYGYTYWDGLFFDRLLPDANRVRAKSEEEKHLPNANWTEDSLMELKLARLANRFFYCSELWNTVTWRYFGTCYNTFTDGDSFKAYKKLTPYEETEFLHPIKAKLELGLQANRELGNYFFIRDSTKRGWIDRPGSWLGFTKYSSVPAGIRGKVLYSLVWTDPYYWKHLTSDEIEREKLMFKRSQEILKSLGIRSYESGQDYEVADYMDWQHLTGRGGKKWAAQTASEVKKFAHSLGYE